MNQRFASASVVKAMLLVAYLRRLAGRGAGLDASSRSKLGPMIHVFDTGGWNPARGRVHQVARLKRGGRRIAIAVLQDGTPSMGYDTATIAGVTRRTVSGA